MRYSSMEQAVQLHSSAAVGIRTRLAHAYAYTLPTPGNRSAWQLRTLTENSFSESKQEPRAKGECRLNTARHSAAQHGTHLEQPQHIKHGGVRWYVRHVANVQLADPGGVGRPPKLQQLLHKHKANDVLLVVPPAWHSTTGVHNVWYSTTGMRTSGPTDTYPLACARGWGHQEDTPWGNYTAAYAGCLPSVMC